MHVRARAHTSPHQLLNDTCPTLLDEVAKSFSLSIYRNALCPDLAEGESSGKHKNEIAVRRMVAE